jgi:6-phosphogluconolactonase
MAHQLRVLYLLIAAAAGAFGQSDVLTYIGTYTRGNSKGIYAYRFQPSTGKLTEIGLVAETPSPSFLAVHPNRNFLYAVNESGAGSVSAFSIDSATGKLTFLNQVPSRGGGPCHVALDRTGKWLFIANYGGGSVAAYPVGEDGKLGEASAFVQHTGSSVNPQRQRGPHAHSVNPTSDGKLVLVTDLGLDQVLTYRLDPGKGTLEPGNPPFSKVEPGSGPRHLAFHPKGRFAYICNEMKSSVTAYSFDAAKGSLEALQTVSMLPADFTGNSSAAEIAVHPTGRFLYASNRGHDSIAIFTIDANKGTLTPAGHAPTQGRTPRNFAIDPSGNYLFAANQDGGNVVLFRIDQKTGKLEPTGDKVEVPLPVCVAFR